jgi:hypothetical protein
MFNHKFIPAAMFAAAVAMRMAVAAADVIVLRETDKNGQSKRIVGRIIETQGVADKEAVLIDSEGKRRLVLKSKIDRIEPSINEKDLEALDPKQPAQYLQLGVKYAQQADELSDPDARECAKHLLWSAVELDASRYAIEAHLQLARLSDDDDSMRHMTHVLRHDPENRGARDQLRELASEHAKRSEQSFDEMVQLLRSSLRDSQWAPLVALAKSQESSMLFSRLEAAYPGLRLELAAIALPSSCTACKGSTRLRCDECRGGRIPCQRCGGRGSFQTTQSSSFIDPVNGNVIVNKVPTRARCPKCNGQRNSPCQKCQDGWITCTACRAQQKAVTINATLRQKLSELGSLLGQPKRTSWAHTLLTEHSDSFHSVANLPDQAPTSLVQGRFYRRSGRWQTTP